VADLLEPSSTDDWALVTVDDHAHPADWSVMTFSDISPDARPLTIEESTYLLQASERVVSLLALDELWSVSLTAAQGSRDAEVDFSGLIGLSERMLDGLSDLAETLPRATDLMSSQPDEALMTGLQRISDQYGPTELFDWLLGHEAARTSLREVFLPAWTWIGDNVAEELEILRGKREILETGNLCDPDFRLRFKCILVVAGLGAATVLAAAGVVATLGIGVTVGLGVLAVAGGTALAWDDSGCGKVRPAHA
jgi:hypothetical protein